MYRHLSALGAAAAITALISVPAAAGAAPVHAPAGDTQSTFAAGYLVHTAPHAVTRVEASWTVPAVTCAATDQSAAEPGIAIGDGPDATNPVQLAVSSACDGLNGPTTPDYFAFSYTTISKTKSFAGEVMPGDKMHGRIVADSNGTYTFTIDNASRGWSDTAKASSPQTTNADVEVTLNNLGGFDQEPIPKFDSSTFSDVQINGKPLKDAAPAKSVLVGAKGTTLVQPSELTADGGGFTCKWLASS